MIGEPNQNSTVILLFATAKALLQGGFNSTPQLIST
jgi:hypothetical protein